MERCVHGAVRGAAAGACCSLLVKVVKVAHFVLTTLLCLSVLFTVSAQ